MSDRLSEIRERLDASPFVDDEWDEDMRWLIEQYAALRSKLAEVRAAAEEAGIVTTVEEFEALPEDALILSVRHNWGHVYRIARRAGGADYYTNEPEPDWNEGISDRGAVFDTDWLPATVIWLPVEGSEG